MKITIYDNYGVLGAEKRGVYTLTPVGDLYDTLTVEIPDELICGRNAADELLLELGGETYTLGMVLCGDKSPCIMVPRANGAQYIGLKVI